MTEKELKPIFKKPYGASQTKHSFGHSSTEGPILCDLCGTTHPNRSKENYSYAWGTILDRQYVEECCGKFVEDLYEQFSCSFVEAFLEDFSENPTDSRFGLFRHMLPEVMEEARKKLNEAKLAIESVTG